MADKKLTNYISDIDIRMEEFNQTHPFSSAQLAEIAKYQRLNELRDFPIAADTKPKSKR